MPKNSEAYRQELKDIRRRILLATSREGDQAIVMKLMAAGAGRATAENLVAGRYWHRPSRLLLAAVDKALGDNREQGEKDGH